jgi:hypothetical protein
VSIFEPWTSRTRSRSGLLVLHLTFLLGERYELNPQRNPNLFGLHFCCCFCGTLRCQGLRGCDNWRPTATAHVYSLRRNCRCFAYRSKILSRRCLMSFFCYEIFIQIYMSHLLPCRLGNMHCPAKLRNLYSVSSVGTTFNRGSKWAYVSRKSHGEKCIECCILDWKTSPKKSRGRSRRSWTMGLVYC